MFLIKKFLLLGIVFTSSVSFAEVDIKSGNFSIRRVDQSLDTEFLGFDIHRTYNSTVSFNGLFGYGWCSTLETKLTVIAKGQIAVTHCGAGEIKIYTSGDFKESNVTEALGQLEKAMQSKQVTMSETLRESLKKNYALRAEKMAEYAVKFEAKEKVFSLVSAPDDESITFKSQNFTLKRRDGLVEKFDNKGRLLSHVSTMGDGLKFDYGPIGMRSVTSLRGQTLSFILNESGKVTQLKGPRGVTWFSYDNEDYLLQVKHSNEIESYTYEKGVLISYENPNGKGKIIYNPVTYLVAKVEEAGCTDEYNYDIQKEAMKFSVSRKRACGKEAGVKVKYEFQYKTAADGAVYQQRMTAADEKGGQTSAEYLANGLPLVVRRQGEEFKYEYDQNNRMVARETRKDRLQFSYNEQGLLDSVQKNVKGKSASRLSLTRYQYERDGRLKSASVNGQLIEYKYNKKGAVNLIKSSQGLEFRIQNDGVSGRVTKVEAKGQGHFDLKYSENGTLLSSQWTGQPEAGLALLDSYEAYLLPLEEGSEIGALK